MIIIYKLYSASIFFKNLCFDNVFNCFYKVLNYQLVYINNMNKKKFYIGILLISLTTLTGCVAMAGITAATTGVIAVQERTAGDAINDTVIYAKIKDRYTKNDVRILGSVDISVVEGRVLLTGSIENSTLLEQASQLAWEVKGVKEVINEIEVTDRSLKEKTTDSLISSQVKTKLLVTENVRSVNYYTHVNKASVYFIGIAQDETELEKVIDITSKVQGVKRVVSHVITKNDPRRG